MTVRPGRGATRINTLLEREYRRRPDRYVDSVLAALLAGIGLFFIPGYASLLIPLYDLSIAEYLRFVAVYELVVLPVGGIALFAVPHRMSAPLFAWTSGRRGSEHAESAWRAAVTQGPRWMARVLVVFWLATLGPGVLVGVDQDFPAFGYPALAFTIATLVAVAGVLLFLIFDQAMRPVVRDIATHLPRDFVVVDKTLSLGRRLNASVPLISFFTALACAAAGYNSLGPEAYTLVMTLVATFIALSFSLLSSVLVSNAVVGRIDDLGTAIRDIDAGDLDTYVRTPSESGRLTRFSM